MSPVLTDPYNQLTSRLFPLSRDDESNDELIPPLLSRTDRCYAESSDSDMEDDIPPLLFRSRYQDYTGSSSDSDSDNEGPPNLGRRVVQADSSDEDTDTDDESVPHLVESQFDSDSDDEATQWPLSTRHTESPRRRVTILAHDVERETVNTLRHEEDRGRLRVSVNASERQSRGSLVDRGANGGILGNDAVVIAVHRDRVVDVSGIDNHEINGLKIVDATAKVLTQRGPAILVLQQYAYHGLLRTIHAAGQIEYYKNRVDDRSMKVGGKQCIKTNEGYVIPLDVHNGLPYLKMVPNTKSEQETLPHIVLTSGEPWDPRVLDHTLTNKEDWYSTLHEYDQGLIPTPFDEYGNYRNRTLDTDLHPNQDDTQINTAETDHRNEAESQHQTGEPAIPNDGITRLEVA